MTLTELALETVIKDPTRVLLELFPLVFGSPCPSREGPRGLAVPEWVLAKITGWWLQRNEEFWIYLCVREPLLRPKSVEIKGVNYWACDEPVVRLAELRMHLDEMEITPMDFPVFPIITIKNTFRPRRRFFLL
jgi:hypothetical protein